MNPNDWLPLVKDRLIDFIRIHISAIGGITPTGHVAQLHIDISSQNFGVREWVGINDAMYQVFSGIPEQENEQS